VTGILTCRVNISKIVLILAAERVRFGHVLSLGWSHVRKRGVVMTSIAILLVNFCPIMAVFVGSILLMRYHCGVLVKVDLGFYRNGDTGRIAPYAGQVGRVSEGAQSWH